MFVLPSARASVHLPRAVLLRTHASVVCLSRGLPVAMLDKVCRRLQSYSQATFVPCTEVIFACKVFYFEVCERGTAKKKKNTI